MIAFLLALGILFQSQQPPKITASVVTKEGVPSTPDSIGETDVSDHDVVTCTSTDDEKETGKGVCYLNLPSGRTTLEARKSVNMGGVAISNSPAAGRAQRCATLSSTKDFQMRDIRQSTAGH
jgi:hypothetical protein